MRLYLAYGSNLSVEQMRFRCPDAKIVDTAVIPNWRLAFKGSQTGSYLTIEQAKGKYVPVAVWNVSESDERALDRYEGYPRFYYKRNFRVVFNGDGKRHECFAYIMDDSRPYGIPTNGYYMTCFNGYKHFGFDTKVLEESLVYSTKKEGYYGKENLSYMWA